MMTSYALGTIASENSSSTEITNAHFQSVLVSKYAFQDSESRLEQGTVFDEGMDALGVSSIRFPGGTEAWDGSFDFRNPDDVAKLHDVLDYCASQNIGMQFTVPVRWFATEELDADGNRIVYISDEDAQALSKFIEEDLLGYATSLGVPIENIKLGNEFLASANGDEYGLDLSSLTPEEYGAAASAVAIIVGESLASFSENNPLAEFTTPPDIVLEMPLWTGGIDRMLEYFDTNASQYISAIDTHGTHMSLEASLDELLGTNANETWYDDMPVADRLALLISHMNDSSAEYGFGELTYLNEAWAVEEAGLDHLAQAILTFHAMSIGGVESATLWTAFSGGDFTTKSAAFTDSNGGRTRMLGELFTEMQSHLVGLTAVDLNTGLTPAEELESGFIVRTFIDEDGRAVVYIANLGEDPMDVDVDLADFLSSIPGFSEGLGDIEALKFGAAKDAFNSFYKSSDMELFDSDYLGIDPVVDGITLGAYEVLQISLTATGEFASQLDDTIHTEGDEDAWIIAYEGDDSITTGSGDDRIDSGDGNDIIDSAGGADLITAGAGNDIVTSGYGIDEVYLGDGDDTFYDEINQTNEWGNDFVDGGDGNDFIYGGGGDDTFYGGNGNDYIEGGSEDDTIHGDEGDDYIDGGSGNDFLLGGNGHDVIYGGADSDTILAGSGNDVVWGGRGKDEVYLGDGDDIFYDEVDQTNEWGNDFVDGGEGNDLIFAGGGSDTLYGGNGDDYIEGGTEPDIIYGGEGNDEIDGGWSADTLYGGEGNDIITGGNGSDFIDGGNGNDLIRSGGMSDTIYAGAGDDIVVGGKGSDEVHLGDGADIFYDSKADGQKENDVIFGDGGNDIIHLGGGDDIASGGEGADIFVFADHISDDTITDFSASDGDLIDLSSYDLKGIEDLAIAIDDQGNAYFEIGNSGSITLEGVDPLSITEECFIF